MAVDRENDVITVIASWRNMVSYEALAKSAAFQAAMAQFARLFASPPEITVNDVLLDMTPDSVSAN